MVSDESGILIDFLMVISSPFFPSDGSHVRGKHSEDLTWSCRAGQDAGG